MKNTAVMYAEPSYGNNEDQAIFLMLAITCRSCPQTFFFFSLHVIIPVYLVYLALCGLVIEFPLQLHVDISGAGTRISPDNLTFIH